MIVEKRVATQEEADALQAALTAYAKSGSVQDRRAAMALYELQSGFIEGCAVCIEGRKMFAQSLTQLLAGDTHGALNNIAGAFGSLAIKLGSFIK